LLFKKIQHCTCSSGVDIKCVDWQDRCQVAASLIAGKSVDDSDEAFSMKLCVHTP